MADPNLRAFRDASDALCKHWPEADGPQEGWQGVQLIENDVSALDLGGCKGLAAVATMALGERTRADVERARKAGVEARYVGALDHGIERRDWSPRRGSKLHRRTPHARYLEKREKSARAILDRRAKLASELSRRA